MSGRVLYRPAGGWGRNSAWRADVARWLAFALLVVGSWGGLNLLVAAVAVLPFAN